MRYVVTTGKKLFTRAVTFKLRSYAFSQEPLLRGFSFFDSMVTYRSFLFISGNFSVDGLLSIVLVSVISTSSCASEPYPSSFFIVLGVPENKSLDNDLYPPE